MRNSRTRKTYRAPLPIPAASRPNPCILLRAVQHNRFPRSYPLLRVFDLRISAPASLFAPLLCLAAASVPLSAQQPKDFGGTHSFGVFATYSPDSSHILIGDSGQRRTWTAGVAYTRRIHTGSAVRLDYEASLIPFFLESDPTVTATSFTSSGVVIVTQLTPERVIRVNHGPIGTILTANGSFAPIYATFGRQNTYAAEVDPIGARITALPRNRLQPTFALNLGAILSTRDLPIDQSNSFNYVFDFGPGIQLFTSQHKSVRLEYLYRHISNAGQGAQNPGIDQGVFRLTVSCHH
jgi:hypothetical protein